MFLFFLKLNKKWYLIFSLGLVFLIVTVLLLYVFSNDLFMNYKLDKMKKTTDTVEYNIIFNVTKDDKGNYKVTDLSNSDLEKIHGVYNYDND